MKRSAVFLFLVFFAASLSAFGRKEAPVREPVNTEYVFCITAFDASALPASRQITGDTVMRNLAASLVNLSYRLRGEEEYLYYRDYAWAKSRTEAAKALAAKRNERDLLIYKGDASWKYRKNRRIVDEAIVKLEEALDEIETYPPVVEGKPVFKLSAGNQGGTFPQPPKEGGEYRFCTEQKADAFLTGNLSEYHGRIYLDIRMYTVHTRSYSFEDSVLFSSVDLTGATDEISVRLAVAATESLSSGVLVHASPPEAMVLIDNNFAGSGKMEEIYTRSAGEAELELRADNYVPVSVPLELKAGELTELFIDLTPLGIASFEAQVPASPGSKVYVGSLYAGESPLVLQLPRTQFAYVSVETPEGKTGSVVYRDNALVKGSAHFVKNSDVSGTAAFNTKIPVSAEEKRVDRARRGFYGAYGAFWIALPVALIAAGIAGSYVDAWNYVAATGMYSDVDDYNTKKKIYDDATFATNVRRAATITWSVALGVTFFQIFRYLYVSGGDSTPIVKTAPLSSPSQLNSSNAPHASPENTDVPVPPGQPTTDTNSRANPDAENRDITALDTAADVDYLTGIEYNE